MFTLPDRLMSDNAMSCIDSAAAALAESAETQFVVDAKALSQFDSAALAVLLDLRRKAAAVGKQIVLQHVQPRLVELATLYGVSRVLGLPTGKADFASV
jgi:phospholipid transport system transporter-binding protein